MKSSELRCRATRWNHARIGFCPANRISASATAALTPASASSTASSPPPLRERRQDDQERDDRQILEQQDAHHVAAVRRGELHALGEHLRHDRRRAHRERAAEREARLPAVADDMQHQHRADGRDRHLREPEPEHRAPHGLQLRQAELEADREHQEDDAEFGEVARHPRCPAPTPARAGRPRCRPAGSRGSAAAGRAGRRRRRRRRRRAGRGSVAASAASVAARSTRPVAM